MTFYRHRAIGPGSAGDIWVTTMHSQSELGIDNVSNAWADFVTGFFTDTMQDLWSTTTGVHEAITDQLDPITGKNVAQITDVANVVGTGTGATVSPRTCVVVSLKTTLPTRAGRGRMFLPSPDSSHYATTGELTDATATAIASGFASKLTIFRGVATPVIYHRSTKTGTPVERIRVSTTLGTQRRRTNKVTGFDAISLF